MLIGILEIVPSENEDMWYWLRRRRDNLLSASDWTQMPDSPLTAEQKTAWATYRQQLRDLPSTLTEAPGEFVEFPDTPS